MIKINKAKLIHTRMAPSPTGWMHLGLARTALFNYLFAKKNQGKFFLRLEDTDLERSKKEYEEDIVRHLKWMGIKWDNKKLYRQSERGKIYEKYIKRLLKEGKAYISQEDSIKMDSRWSLSRATMRDGNDKIEKRKTVIRFKTPHKKIIVNDLIRGRVEFDTSQLGDFVIAKDEKTPLYHLAVVIDDYEMKITHIIRGEDHLSNTPKHILLQETLNFPRPLYAHIPLILGQDRTKLSKRHGAVPVKDYKFQGYLPEALINLIALLGWNPGDNREIFTLKDLIKEFSLEKVQKSGAVFNIEKLDWLNGYYIRQMDLEELTKKCASYLEKYTQMSLRATQPLAASEAWRVAIPKHTTGLLRRLPPPRNDNFQIIATGEIIDLEWLKKIVALEQPRLKKLSEIWELTDFFFKPQLEYDKELLRWKEMAGSQILDSLKTSLSFLEKINAGDFNAKDLERILMTEAEKRGDRGALLWPLRVALSGKKASAGPFEIMEILGKEKTLKRIKEAITL